MPREREEARPFHFNPEQVRHAEKLHEEQGSVTFTVALLDPQGKMIAHTNGLFLAAAPREVYQAMTGVSAEYRGRGLAKWLKAELFVRIGMEYPANESFVTEMRAVNEPILAINRQMGYYLEGRGHEIAIDTGALRKFVSGGA